MEMEITVRCSHSATELSGGQQTMPIVAVADITTITADTTHPMDISETMATTTTITRNDFTSTTLIPSLTTQTTKKITSAIISMMITTQTITQTTSQTTIQRTNQTTTLMTMPRIIILMRRTLHQLKLTSTAPTSAQPAMRNYQITSRTSCKNKHLAMSTLIVSMTIATTTQDIPTTEKIYLKLTVL